MSHNKISLAEETKDIEEPTETDPTLELTEENKLDQDKAPKLPFIYLFAKFLWFGMRAFGGPAAQITLMKTELVDDENWITVDRFTKVYAVYQIVPGPEAYELAVFFGYLSRWIPGGLLGGLGFALPGCILEVVISYFYVRYGVSGPNVQASFKCVQIAVSAMIFRAVYKLAEGILCDPSTKVFVWDRGYIFLFNFFTSMMGLNFFASLAVSGVMNTLFDLSIHYPEKLKLLRYIGYFMSAGTIAGFYVYSYYQGKPDPSITGDNTAGASLGTDYLSLFVLALIAGCVSFGGAYTTIPFIYNIAVTKGAWITPQQFLDAVAIVNMLPTPLVSFVATIGFIGNGVGGSILMLIGIFLPATILPIIGHDFLQKVAENEIVHPFLDGVASAVLGLLLMTSLNFLKQTVLTGLDSAVFFISFAALFWFTNKFTQPLLIICAAIAGQILYLK